MKIKIKKGRLKEIIREELERKDKGLNETLKKSDFWGLANSVYQNAAQVMHILKTNKDFTDDVFHYYMGFLIDTCDTLQRAWLAYDDELDENLLEILKKGGEKIKK